MAPKHKVDLTDEPTQPKKLTKFDPIEDDDPSHTGPNDEDNETKIDNDEDEEAVAAAAAARSRAAREQDDPMAGVQSSKPTTNGTVNGASPDDDEIDPLDAFMADLEGGSTSDPQAVGLSNADKTADGQAYFSDEEDNTTAVGENPDSILDLTKKPRKRKDIPKIDHAKMQYDDVRKQFYREPSEISQMDDEQVQQIRFALDGTKVRGKDVPKPVQSFSQCGLGTPSLEVLKGLGFEGPTAIQAQAIPAIMSGRDMIGVAKTGSGKTIAFLLPMFRHIKDQRPLKSLEGPIGLVMAPTRELATQIHKECRPWLKALGLRAVCAYGGTPIADHIAELKRGAEIVVATPGRLIDLLTANQGRVTNLKRVTYCVLDEADRMFDMGFEPQITKIISNIRPTRQTVLFSATFPPKMENLCKKVLTAPVEIIVGGKAKVAPEIQQVVEVRNENAKFLRLLQLLGEVHQDEEARSLLFVDRQEAAEGLMNQIMKRGYPCHTLHGGKDQYDRDSIIADFKAGIFPVLVATSVAARGLDVKQLKMVVNYDAPNHLEDYVHRAGRTGRAGNKGLAVTFITEEQGRYAVDIVKALTHSETAIPEDLQKLADNFTERVKQGKEKVVGRGFGGRGINHLDLKRDAEKSALRKVYRTGDEPDEEEEKPASTDENLKKLDAIKVQPAGSSEEKPAGSDENAENSDKQQRAVHPLLDENRIQVHRTEKENPGPKKNTMSLVTDNVAMVNARLRKTGDIRGSAPIDNKGPDAGAYHSTLEINDFPQKARWAVTNRTNVAKILESTGTSITTKGNYYPADQTPSSTDPPKLYILVEGDTELLVTTAMRELMRLLREGVEANTEMQARTSTTGRYNVLD